MRRAYFFVLCLILSACLTWGQSEEDLLLHDGQVGVPYFADLGFSEIFTSEDIADGFFFRLTIAGGALPPGLSMSTSGQFTGIPTQAGNFPFTIRFTFGFTDETEPFSIDFDFPAAIQITGSAVNGVAVAPGGITISVLSGSGPQPQAITVSNLGTATQNFTASVTMDNGSGWLLASPASGSIGSFGSVTVQLSIRPESLAPGVYRGSIAIAATPAGQSHKVPVIVTVGSGSQSIQLSQTGVRFQAVQGGPAPASESVRVLGTVGTLPFQVQTSTRSGGNNWLTATPSSGSAPAGGSASITIGANPSGLAPGDYYGEVRITSSAADNSPQTLTVVLNVLPGGTLLAPQPSTTGLLFTGRRNGPAPASQVVTVRSLTSTPLNYAANVFLANGTNWLAVTPASGIIAPNQPASLNIAANTTGLAAGVYRGEIVLSFAEDVPRVNIAILLIVLPPASSQFRSAEGCTPTKLLPVFTRLGAGFASPVGWPASLTLTVVDDCGDPLRTGTVQASFSNGDPPLSLLPLGDGTWSATWQPQAISESLVITVNAAQAAPPLTGSYTLGGSSEENPSVPLIFSGGIVSAASYQAFQPSAPGAFISIFGSGLSTGLIASPSAPYGTQLGNTQIALGSKLLPLQFTADGQVNAIVPYDVPANTTQQLIVTNGNQISLPQPVVIAPAQPGIFTQPGTTAGIVAAIKPDGRGVYPLTAENRAAAGDVLVIYAAGLGPVNPPVPAGAAAEGVSQTVDPVTLNIGGREATVIFAGLAPGFPGVYQINASVPAGIEPGAAVPMVLSVSGQSSAPATIAIQ